MFSIKKLERKLNSKKECRKRDVTKLIYMSKETYDFFDSDGKEGENYYKLDIVNFYKRFSNLVDLCLKFHNNKDLKEFTSKLLVAALIRHFREEIPDEIIMKLGNALNWDAEIIMKGDEDFLSDVEDCGNYCSYLLEFVKKYNINLTNIFEPNFVYSLVVASIYSSNNLAINFIIDNSIQVPKNYFKENCRLEENDWPLYDFHQLLLEKNYPFFI